MKTILFSMLMISTFAFSQIKESDFTKVNGRFGIKEKTFLFKNGNNENVPVITTIYMNETDLQKLSIDKVNQMLLASNEKTPYQLKNKSTYSPKSIRVDLTQENDWRVMLDYTAQNDFGGTKDGMIMVFFNYDGTFKNLVTL